MLKLIKKCQNVFQSIEIGPKKAKMFQQIKFDSKKKMIQRCKNCFENIKIVKMV